MYLYVSMYIIESSNCSSNWLIRDAKTNTWTAISWNAPARRSVAILSRHGHTWNKAGAISDRF